MDIEAVKANQAVARVAMRGRYTLAVRRAVEIYLPDAIELIEEQHFVLDRVLNSLEVCPWCYRNMETDPGGHAKDCKLAAVLAKIRPSRCTSGPA